MEQTLKITNVLSDPTRFHIYEFIVKKNADVTVQDIAEAFEIHPNVARLHLSKLEDVNMLHSHTKKTGRGGRPSRVYNLSKEVVQLHFPFRDYQLLAQIAFEAFAGMGEAGQEALYTTGKKFGKEMMEREASHASHLDRAGKLEVLKAAAEMTGLFPEFHNQTDDTIVFTVNNCPFKEVASHQKQLVCEMHSHFLKGMFEAMFQDIVLKEEHNMMDGCANCLYKAQI
ncbi:helix-turn-helix transcriptional regulator [Thalassobacillus devorans]|uniref:helix-turn-helix transcriptional regulator n=1 Tax=Thalassobacillus devorans TaxID=279813 RepID=UPI000A1CBB01|nr:helix-turn-helix domain-containing protein [Thalassobacillus devorans]